MPFVTINKRTPSKLECSSYNMHYKSNDKLSYRQDYKINVNKALHNELYRTIDSHIPFRLMDSVILVQHNGNLQYRNSASNMAHFLTKENFNT